MVLFCVGYLLGLATFVVIVLIANVTVYGNFRGR